MQAPLLTRIDPWRFEIIVIVGRSHSSAERRSISRDVERGLLVRLLQGAYVERVGFESLNPEDQHIVRIRALVALSSSPQVISHWSAAVLNALPVLRSRLTTVHITVEDEDVRHRPGVTAHSFLINDDVVQFGEVLATPVGRTVVDVAGASPFEEGVMTADGALRAGVPREILEAAVAQAGPRRASRRIREVVGFAHAGAESAGESRLRVTMARLGVEVPTLQYRLLLDDGSEIFLDAFLPTAMVGVEFDGEQKYLDAAMAPDGAGRAVITEKRREDQARRQLSGLARFGWIQAGSVGVVRSVFARVGVFPTRPRTTIADYSAAARAATPRFPLRTRRWRA